MKNLTSVAYALLPLAAALLIHCSGKKDGTAKTADSTSRQPAWALGPFTKQDAANPVLTPLGTTTFLCPIRGDTVRWEAKDVFNPAAVVRAGKIYLLYRAEDTVGKYAGTSRLGLAESSDGLHFTRGPKPVFYPARDAMRGYEWEGGCEDPRVVEAPDGRYVLTYTAYDGKTARLCVATSPDLRTWQKHGLAFEKAGGGKYKDLWSKSGAILCTRQGDRVVATAVNGTYWMYWGDTHMYAATSPDLIHWTPVTDAAGGLSPVFGPRPGHFDSRLVEPGPFALLEKEGIVLIYNSMNLDKNQAGYYAGLPPGTYTAGQVLLDAQNPARVLDRTGTYFMKPDKPYEMTGQVNHVVFVEGLAHHQNRWFLYYGTADSKIAVAVAEGK
ncbi:MAG: glycosidase [Cytophagales bacterium]|nr:glycosidase [Cytophagales bacterium]